MAPNDKNGLDVVVQEVKVVARELKSTSKRGERLNDVLDFLEELISVLRYSFQQVHTLLQRLAHLRAADLTDKEIAEIQERIGDLRFREWWNAEGICKRLKALGRIYNEPGSSISLAVQGLQNQSNWKPIMDLITYHEGEIVSLVTRELGQYSNILFQVTNENLNKEEAASQIRLAAYESISPTIAALHELDGLVQELKGQLGPLGEDRLLTLREVAKERVRDSPWISGLFYLFSFLAVGTMLILAAKNVPLVTFPAILIATPLSVAIIGALQLKQDGKLSELGFLELMRITFTQLPLIRLFRKPSSQATDNDAVRG